MSYIVYELDEFQPWPGQACYIYGTAIVTYDWEAPDPDSGYRGGPVNLRLLSLVISGDKEPLIIPHGTPFFDIVDRAVGHDEHIAAQCVKDHEDGARFARGGGRSGRP